MVTFTVTGKGLFPFDMLRYDYCYPKTEQDSAMIERTTRRGATQEVFEVNLSGSTRPPTRERWESFGWKVQ